MAEIRIDCLYEVCPIPLLKAIESLKKAKDGDLIIIETDHNCSITNVVNWAKKNGHNVDYVETSEGLWEIYLQKGK